MKAKNILMTLLLVTGAIAAKAGGFPPELALVSQPVMVYNANSITVYYDVENIGDYTYRGSVYLYLSPDEGYYYADEWIKVRPGRIKRIAIDIPAYRIRRGHAFTIMPYYELGDELYSFTTFEYFEPITFYWDGPRNEPWVVVKVGPRVRYYTRPGSYRYYYDGFRPPMPPPPGYGPATPPPPMDPMHHTYGYHKEHNWYSGNHFGDDHGPKPDHNGEAPKPHDNEGATVRPDNNAGSMSGSHSNGNNGGNNNGSSSGSGNGKPDTPANNGSSSGSNAGSGRTPANGSSSVDRPSSNSTTNGTSRPSGNGTSNSSNVSRPSGSSTTSGTSRPSSNGTSSNSSNVSRPSSSSTSSGTSRPSSNGSSSVNRNNSGSSSGSSARSGSSSGSSSTRKSNTSSSNRSGSSSSTRSSSSSGSSSIRK